MGAQEGNVRVVARIRPLSKTELGRGSKEKVTSLSALENSLRNVHQEPTDEPELVQVQPDGGKKRWFELDAVFDKSSTQEEVYMRCGAKQSVTEDIFKGFNCTILAYGQTGAGKTFSMGTAPQSGGEIGEMDGMIPRCCYDLFQTIDEKCDGNAKVELSYLEIYNEELRDLLVDDNNKKPLKIRETLDGEVYVAGIEQREVKSPEDIGRLMEEASGRRIVAATAMNAVSSRSHAMCVLRVQGVIEGPEGTDKFQSKLTLVDLAGSERIKKTGAQGGRVKEGININKSLLILGQVVAALAEQDKKRKRKPPYRDSKLTRLLQDSLGGNSRTIMVACVSPADFNIDESINTLRYATSARNIKNTATRNLVKNISPEEAAKLQRENQLLKQQVAELQETIKMMTIQAQSFSPSPSFISDENDEASIQSAAAKSEVSPAENDEETKEKEEDGDGTAPPAEEGAAADGTDAETDNQPDNRRDSKRIKELEKENAMLKKEVNNSKETARKSFNLSNAAVEIPALKKELEEMREEVSEKRKLEDENLQLRDELEEVKNEAECALAAATKLSDVMDKLQSLSTDDTDRKRMQYEHLKKEEAWVSFVCQMLDNNKEQIRKLNEDFDLVIRVVESPLVMSVPGLTDSSQNKATKKKWWGGVAEGLQEEAQMTQVFDAEMRQQLLTEHVEFFNDRMKEIETTIDAESDSLKAIRLSLRKDREKLQNEIGINEFMQASLDRSDKDLLQQLTTLLIGPVKFVES